MQRDITRTRQDALTGLPTSAALYHRLHQALVEARSGSRTCALLLVDLDGFREVNITLGHQNGDLLLQQVGERMRGALRASDTLARLGGDKFAVLLPDLGEPEQATTAACQLLTVLEEPFFVEGIALEIGASIGSALYPEHGEDATTLLRHAAVAMSSAKESRSGYAFYAACQDQHDPHHLALMGELRQAIGAGQLVLHYQPKVSLDLGRTIGVEALVRWQHPHRGLLSPDQFIPLAERIGLIKAVTPWVAQTAMRQSRAWVDAGLDLSVAVNISARDLIGLTLLDQLTGLLETNGAPPHLLKLEITESGVMADPGHARDILTRLSAKGVKLAIDDFGTGYSSLQYLKSLPVHEIKIDQSFVKGLMENKNDAVIVRSTINLGHDLGLTVVAEGVENRETWLGLVALGCDTAQGFFLGRPVPAADLTHWLRTSPWGA